MKALVGFTLLYMVGLFLYGLAVDSPLTLTYTGITVLIVITFALLHQWAKFPLWILWVISLVGLGNMIGGVVLVDGKPMYVNGYIGPIPFDKFFHSLAAFAFFFVAWHAMKAFAGPGYHRPGLLTFTFLVVMGGGAVVEIVELIGTVISEVNVGDYGNNALDLVANAIGAALGLIVILFIERPTEAGDG